MKKVFGHGEILIAARPFAGGINSGDILMYNHPDMEEGFALVYSLSKISNFFLNQNNSNFDIEDFLYLIPEEKLIKPKLNEKPLPATGFLESFIYQFCFTLHPDYSFVLDEHYQGKINIIKTVLTNYERPGKN